MPPLAKMNRLPYRLANLMRYARYQESLPERPQQPGGLVVYHGTSVPFTGQPRLSDGFSWRIPSVFATNSPRSALRYASIYEDSPIYYQTPSRVYAGHLDPDRIFHAQWATWPGYEPGMPEAQANVRQLVGAETRRLGGWDKFLERYDAIRPPDYYPWAEHKFQVMALRPIFETMLAPHPAIDRSRPVDLWPERYLLPFPSIQAAYADPSLKSEPWFRQLMEQSTLPEPERSRLESRYELLDRFRYFADARGPSLDHQKMRIRQLLDELKPPARMRVTAIPPSKPWTPRPATAIQPRKAQAPSGPALSPPAEGGQLRLF